MKVKTAEKIANTLIRRPRAQALQMQKGAGVQIQGFELMLGKIANGQMLAAGALTVNQRGLTPQTVHKGRFTRTIRAKQTNAAAR